MKINSIKCDFCEKEFDEEGIDLCMVGKCKVAWLCKKCEDADTRRYEE